MEENVNSNWFEDRELPKIDSEEDLKKALSIVKLRFNGTPKHYTRNDYLLLINTLYASINLLYQNNEEDSPVELIEELRNILQLLELTQDEMDQEFNNLQNQTSNDINHINNNINNLQNQINNISQPQQKWEQL